ncbi:MAG TPA: hypothetical protein VLC46_02945 [Thermoanaerobaculia bacterium]|jgi:hypothetical protein|nr:hypothetical protein [Thermoanaerobaculia bacterium]
MRTALVCIALALALVVPTFAADDLPAVCNLSTAMPPSKDTVKFENALRPFLTAACYDKLGWTHDAFIRDTGPYILGDYYGTHPAVRIWYSPEVASWMKLTAAQRAVTPISDNAVIVKEMYSGPANCYPMSPPYTPPVGCFPSPFSKPQTTPWWTIPGQASWWTVMVREANASHDGWYWSGSAGSSGPVPTDLGNTTYPSAGFGNYCINCHASAVSNSTYSTMRNVEGTNTITYLNVMLSMGNPTPVHADSHRAKMLSKGGAPILAEEPFDYEMLKILAPWWKKGDDLKSRNFPGETWDHVMAMKNGPEQFITSDQCIGCHDGTANIGPYPANMIYPASGSISTPVYNVSPYGEWRASLMGLSGRDPVFFSQIASELKIHANAKLPGQTIPNICFRCHGAMGQRQLTIDSAGKKMFDPELVYAWSSSLAQPVGDAKIGALARDSISCTVCHHISDKDLGKPPTYTGQFNTTDPGTIIGPFTDPLAKPMNHALDMTPMHTEYVRDSKLCGSCHTILLPVLDAKGVQVKEDFEQTTYFEWQNSVFQNEQNPVTDDAQTCQQCHMPSTFKLKEFHSQDLAYRIANMEDSTYPYVDDRLPDPDITLQSRTGYARHTLVGINLFVQEMFLQFSDQLGIRTADPMVATDANNDPIPLAGLKLAEQATIDLARQETAVVEVMSMKKTTTDLEVKVGVKNNAGHSFPSGVSFRRAFLDFEVLDKDGNPIWASGATNPFGMITNGVDGAVLPSEFFDGGQYQDHHTEITDQGQVQIYEELVKDTEGHFTTSFLSLYDNIKRNRLLPRGWKPGGPHAEETGPRGSAAKDPDYLSGCGCDTIIYRVPLSKIPNAAKVQARIYYQTVPPYYLRQRFTDTYNSSTHTAAENTRRLMDFIGRLNVASTEIHNWKLFVAGTTQTIH